MKRILARKQGMKGENVIKIMHVYREYVLSCGIAGKRKVQLPVEPSGSSQGGIYGIEPIGRSYDYDLGAVVQAVHQGQQGRHDARVHKVLSVRSHRGQTVDLVEEYYARPALLRLGRVKTTDFGT